MAGIYTLIAFRVDQHPQAGSEVDVYIDIYNISGAPRYVMCACMKDSEYLSISPSEPVLIPADDFAIFSGKFLMPEATVILTAQSLVETYPGEWIIDAEQQISVWPEIPTPRVLTMKTTAGGTTDPSPGSWGYEDGSSVTITAYPYSGYEFKHWLEGGAILSVLNPFVIYMDSDRTITAVFEEIVTPPPEPEFAGFGITEYTKR